MVVIPPGAFLMGSTEAERDWALQQAFQQPFSHFSYLAHERVQSEAPQHRVKITAPFAAGRYPVTFEEYDRFATETGRELPGDRNWGRGRRPVINVSWEAAKAYVAWLSQETSQPYRLLSEAEWEYACRAGTTTRYAWGDDDPTLQQANFSRNNGGKTTDVGTYPPNFWGLYDMHGNINECVEDCWNDSYEGAPNDGSAWRSGDHSRRVLRGGSWAGGPVFLRSASRDWLNPRDRSYVVGCRVARTLVRRPVPQAASGSCRSLSSVQVT